jgi:putative flavoprotein involved in K+ transport
MTMRDPEAIDTVIIGAGQAGLSVGYHLARRGVPFVILEANQRVGDGWRNRWDSLRLFTPARFDGLDGLPFPARPFHFPTKDEMGDYLESYARRFGLPVRTGVRVDGVFRSGDGFLVSAGESQLRARHVVVAMANYQRPRVPGFAAELDAGIVQLHSRDYRNPGQLRAGGVLIVGAGNSGAEIAVELARAGHRIWLSGNPTGEIPFRIGSRVARLGLARVIFRVLFHRVLTLGTPVGRKARPRLISRGAPLIRTRQADLAAAGVTRVPRTAGVRHGLPLLDDGQVLDVANVIWCTGYEPGFGWIDLPVFDGHGEPVQTRGITAVEPRLGFVGLHFLYAMSSAMIHGVGRDAEYLAARIAADDGEGQVAGVPPRVSRQAAGAA